MGSIAQRRCLPAGTKVSLSGDDRLRGRAANTGPAKTVQALLAGPEQCIARSWCRSTRPARKPHGSWRGRLEVGSLRLPLGDECRVKRGVVFAAGETAKRSGRRAAARPARCRPSSATVALDARPRACQGPSSSSPYSRSRRIRRRARWTFRVVISTFGLPANSGSPVASTTQSCLSPFGSSATRILGPVLLAGVRARAGRLVVSLDHVEVAPVVYLSSLLAFCRQGRPLSIRCARHSHRP